MTLPEYIMRSIAGAWQIAKGNPNVSEQFDMSSDGFWKSFWAIAVMSPIFFIWAYFNLKHETFESSLNTSYPILSETVFFVVILPTTAFVMAYFTKFMKISENYFSMVIAYNWVSALVYCIVTSATIILSSGLIGGSIAGVILILLKFYFGGYVIWLTLKSSLNISGILAFGVWLFINLFNSALLALLLKFLNPEYINAIVNNLNNLPS